MHGTGKILKKQNIMLSTISNFHKRLTSYSKLDLQLFVTTQLTGSIFAQRGVIMQFRDKNQAK